MKKRLLLFMLSAVMWGQSLAADKVPGAVIELSSGKTVEIALTDNPKMTFDGTTVKLTAVNVNVEYTPAEIAKVTIGEVESSVSGINSVEASQATMSVEGGFVRLSGFTANETVKVYTLNGVQTDSFQTDINGSMDHWPSASHHCLMAFLSLKRTIKQLKSQENEKSYIVNNLSSICSQSFSTNG